MIISNLIGFIGTVVNINGEGINFGKVQIRIVGDQDVAIPTENLLWATVMVPTTSAAEQEIGTTPNWLIEGSTVIGVFIDGNYRSMPLVLGAINQDKPHGPGISRLASGGKIPNRTFSDLEKLLGVEKARKPNYRDNKVITTASKADPTVINHIIELDDTPKSERVLVKHKNGSYIEFLPDGKVVIRGTEVLSAMAKSAIFKAFKQLAVDSDGTMELGATESITVESETISLQATTLNLIADDINIEGNLTLQGDVDITGNVGVVGSMTLNGRPVATT